MSRHYLTTPIYYVNAPPHVGHAYTTIAADVLTRARRLAGHDAFLLTGTDEHGQNIERIARERGISAQQHCDEIAGRFQALWQRYDIRYDGFIRTTSDLHRDGVLALWKRLVSAETPDGQKAIYTDTYSGLYCPRCEAFKDEEELKQPGNICPDHELPCEWTQEENFFFRLSAYAPWLRDAITSGALRIDPDVRRNEVLAVIEQGLKDFSVSRARVKWGIPVPEQPDHVLYVWVDALSNYITALGFATLAEPYQKYWAGGGERMHLVGKDIIRFHCLYWPAILKAAGVLPPNRIFVQGHITKNGKKLSKTTGNVIDPEALVAEHGPDAVRYFLLREGTYGHDWDFTDTAFVTRFNADLANDFGNLVSRALTMVQKYCAGKVPPRPASPGSGAPGREQQLQIDAASLTAGVLARYEALDFSGALGELWGWVSDLNRRIVEVEPWNLAKDHQRLPELQSFLHRLLESIRLIAMLVSPVIPRASGRVLVMLGLPSSEPVAADLIWGRLVPGTPLGKIEPLFPRLESLTPDPSPGGTGGTVDDGARRGSTRDALTPNSSPPDSGGPVPGQPPGHKEHSVSETNPTLPAAATPVAALPMPGANQITIDDFAKLELRVAKVLSAEKIQGATKLLKLQVDLGSEQRRIVSGIAEAYTPEELVGRSVVLVANLKPVKLRGVESQGMVLAASLDGRAVLCQPDKDVPAGTLVK